MHLLRLQRRGLVDCIRGPEGKVVYCITDKGRARLGRFPKRSEFLNKARNIQYETLLFLRGPMTVMVKPDWPYNFIVRKRTLYSAVDLTEKLGIGEPAALRRLYRYKQKGWVISQKTKDGAVFCLSRRGWDRLWWIMRNCFKDENASKDALKTVFKDLLNGVNHEVEEELVNFFINECPRDLEFLGEIMLKGLYKPRKDIFLEEWRCIVG